MRATRPANGTIRTGVVAVTTDPALEQLLQATFKASAQIDLEVIGANVAEAGDTLDADGATVVIVDLDTARADEMMALERLMNRLGSWPPVVVITPAFDADVARRLMQMRVADFQVKPVQPVELVRTCARVARPVSADSKEAQISTFLSAVGGAGVTTIAIQTAMLLLNSGARARPSVCLVDLNSRTAPAPTISILSRAWTSTRSNRGRSVSTASFWRSCWRSIVPGCR